MNTSPDITPQREFLFPDIPQRDGYLELPTDPISLWDFLEDRNSRVYSLDYIKNTDLNRIFGEYFRPYPRKNHSGLSVVTRGCVRLFKSYL
ncbi:hypothetical protein HY383_04520 [Candidatus Daviesbacteria bacterium]|nr:hypothetical protein [Candidatus Daviesbacteria bacterium]